MLQLSVFILKISIVCFSSDESLPELEEVTTEPYDQTEVTTYVHQEENVTTHLQPQDTEGTGVQTGSVSSCLFGFIKIPEDGM